MKKRLISIALVLALVLALAPAAMADEGVRDTEFFQNQPHSDKNFSEMTYTPVSEADFLAAIDEGRALLDSAANESKVQEIFDRVADMFQTVNGNLTLLTIRSSLDVTDDECQALYLQEYSLAVDITDPFIFFIQDILKSPCDGFMRAQISEEDAEYYLEYGGSSDEQKALSKELAGIEDKYWDAYFTEYTYVYGDEVWTSDMAEAAVNAGYISVDEYNVISTAIARERNEAMGAVYMEGLELNTKLAATYGYDNYGDFAYEMSYGYDYTPEEILEYADAVKEYIVPLADEVYTLYSEGVYALDYDGYYGFYAADYTDKDTLDAIRPCIASMSDELLETWDYMIGHDLYDITASETKDDAGFTTLISGYGAPFFFNSPYGFLADFSTIVHEFGHYNNFYWHPNGWNDGNSNIDVAEVHSQAMELLFTNFYPQLFGDNYLIAEDLLMYNLLYSAIINGAMYGELEIYASTTPNVTLRQINEKYRELAAEYGLVDESDPRTEMYGWIETHHLTTQPMYYISYSTSAAGAFAFWLEAQEKGFNTAVDHYLQFVSQSVYMPFQEQFETVGMENPLDPSYIEELAGELTVKLGLNERLTALQRSYMFPDVVEGKWYYDYVWAAIDAGYMNGKSDGNFDPNGTASRYQAVAVLWNMMGNQQAASPAPFADTQNSSYADAVNWAAEEQIVGGSTDSATGQQVFNGKNTINRQEMIVMLYRLAQAAGRDTTSASDLSSFKDASSVSSWARDAMSWAVNNGIIEGSDGSLLPKSLLKRSQMAKIIVTFAEYMNSTANRVG